jgi:hypothetical protein
MGFQMFLKTFFVFYGDKGINKIMYNFAFLPFNFRNLILNFKMLDNIWFCNIGLLSTIYYNFMSFEVILYCIFFSSSNVEHGYDCTPWSFYDICKDSILLRLGNSMILLPWRMPRFCNTSQLSPSKNPK